MFEYKSAKIYHWKFAEVINLGKIEAVRWSIMIFHTGWSGWGNFIMICP